MTSGASLRNTQESLVQILHLDERAISRSNVLGVMTFVAGQASVFSLKRISSLLVVKRTWIPLYDREILSVVIGVAAHASLARARLLVVRGVQSAVRSQPPRNLGMTFETLKCWLAGRKLVAGCAVRRAIERLMRAR